MNNKRAFRKIPSSEGWFLKTFNVRLRRRLQTTHKIVELVRTQTVDF